MVSVELVLGLGCQQRRGWVGVLAARQPLVGLGRVRLFGRWASLAPPEVLAVQLELALPEQLLVLVVVDWPGRLGRQLAVVE